MDSLIAREWRGECLWERAEEYAEVLHDVVAEACETGGRRGFFIRRYREGSYAVFLVTTLWDNVETLRLLLGEDWERAVHAPEEAEYLLNAPEYVQHSEVLSTDYVAAVST